MGLLYLGPANTLELPEAPIVRLSNVDFEHDASSVRLSGAGREAYLYNRNWTEFLKRRHAWFSRAAANQVPANVRDRARLGIALTNLEVAQRMRHPATAKLAQRVARTFPTQISLDQGAERSQWPGIGPWNPPRASRATEDRPKL